MALRSQVRVGKRTLVVYNLHLESRGHKLRCAQLMELLGDARRYDHETPIILAGDFNLDVTENSVASSLEEMHFQNPFKAEHIPTARSRCRRELVIDSILIRGAVDVSAAQVHHFVSASDHFPLSLTMKFR
jgi:endonuclease/exonuclease/phosphatase family metal-dependent hydrolase